MKPREDRITVRISHEAHAALKAAAAKDDRPLSGLVRVVISDFLKSRRADRDQAKRDQQRPAA